METWPFEGTFPSLIRIAADRYTDLVFIEDGAEQMTFGDLPARVDGAAAALIALDVEPGDRVAIWAPNVWEWIIASLALQSVGAVLVPINTRYKGGEAAWILRRSRARVLFTVTAFLDTDYVALLAAADEALPDLQHTIVMRGPAPSGTTAWASLLAAGGSVDRAQVAARASAVTSEDLCDVLFTSGTTGRPKGVMCTHRQTLRAFRDWAEVVGLRAGDRYLVIAPFFHAFGYKAGWLAALMTGATVLPEPVFDARVALGRVELDRISMLPGPPALYQTILNLPDLGATDISSLRLAVTGAAVIPVQLIRDLRQRLGFETVITGYGLTEATGIATMCRHDDDPETIATTSGRAIPGVEVRVAAPDGSEVPAGEPGEVLVRGYNVMRGYLDDPAATAGAIDSDGWLHTGDIGVMNAAGYLAITDRLKDMIIVGGFNVYPAEVERLLSDHPAISQAAVVGAPDQRLGEIPVAFMVPATGDTLPDADALTAWCRENMANFKVPRLFVPVETLPRNAAGKVLKFELRAALAETAGRRAASA